MTSTFPSRPPLSGEVAFTTERMRVFSLQVDEDSRGGPVVAYIAYGKGVEYQVLWATIGYTRDYPTATINWIQTWTGRRHRGFAKEFIDGLRKHHPHIQVLAKGVTPAGKALCASLGLRARPISRKDEDPCL